MNKLFFIAVLILFSTTSFAEQEIKITYFNTSPFVIYDKEEEKVTGGAVYEFLELYIGPKTGVKFVWEKSPSSIPRQLNSIENIDIITPPEERCSILTLKPTNKKRKST